MRLGNYTFTRDEVSSITRNVVVTHNNNDDDGLIELADLNE